jgi:hypothetical protein
MSASLKISKIYGAKELRWIQYTGWEDWMTANFDVRALFAHSKVMISASPKQDQLEPHEQQCYPWTG